MNIIITGCSKGIGYETALEFCKNPENKVFGISRNILALEDLKNKTNYQNFEAIGFDLSESIDKSDILKSEIFSRLNRVDILINNAGHLLKKDFLQTNYKEINQLMQTNLFAIGEIIRILHPLMGHDRPSHIVNIGSMGGYQGSKKFRGLAWYSVSKAALANLTECLSEEFIDDQIFVNCLALGSVQTEMLSNAFPGYNARLTAQEMATYIVQFAMNGYKYFNGKVLPVSHSNP